MMKYIAPDINNARSEVRGLEAFPYEREKGEMNAAPLPLREPLRCGATFSMTRKEI
jgi:hypothetical protein